MNDNSKSTCTSSSNSNLGQGLGLENINYADYIILSATLSYAIAEELNDTDLDMLIVFAGMIASDLALLRTKRGIIKGKNAANQVANNQNTKAEAIIGGIEGSISGEISSSLSRNKKTKNKKRIKKE